MAPREDCSVCSDVFGNVQRKGPVLPKRPVLTENGTVRPRRACPARGAGEGAKGASWLTPVPVTPRRWVSLRGASGGPHILQMRGGLSALPGRKAAPSWLQSEVARPGDKARR